MVAQTSAVRTRNWTHHRATHHRTPHHWPAHHWPTHHSSHHTALRATVPEIRAQCLQMKGERGKAPTKQRCGKHASRTRRSLSSIAASCACMAAPITLPWRRSRTMRRSSRRSACQRSTSVTRTQSHIHFVVRCQRATHPCSASSHATLHAPLAASWSTEKHGKKKGEGVTTGAVLCLRRCWIAHLLEDAAA